MKGPSIFRIASIPAQLKTGLSLNFSSYEMFPQFQIKEEDILKIRTERGHVLLQILTEGKLYPLKVVIFVNIPKTIRGDSSGSCGLARTGSCPVE